jgi:hypothetical protein
MAEAVKDEVQRIILEEVRRWFDAVTDNIQTYAKQCDPRLGKENRMIKGHRD